MAEKPFEPYVPASKSIPELTAQALILGILLSFIMCAANVYIGLYAGMTVSAAIPASVISMGVLRGLLKRGTILENNIVHTIASSGESLAAGIIFTVPALVLSGVWETFNYWETTLIAIAGGVLGVMMMIPLRRALIIEEKELRYPEGVACAEVLKAGDVGGAHLGVIFGALGVGALFKAFVKLTGLVAETAEGAFRAGRTALYGGVEVSAALLGVGYIIGLDISLLVFLGGAIAWAVAIPVLVYTGGGVQGSALDTVWDIWNNQIRYLGIGAMVVGGIWSIIKVRNGIKKGLQSAFAGFKKTAGIENMLRTDQDIRGRQLLSLAGVVVALTFIVYWLMLSQSGVSTNMALGTSLLSTVLMFITAFFFVAVASYIAGLVGSSNNPVSGMTICTVLITAAVMLLLGYTGNAGILATLGVAGVVCCAACTAGDISQDLKIGYLLGGTPRRQQWAEVVGTVLPAFIIAPTMAMLAKAYGIGKPLVEGQAFLKAPQAMLFSKLVSALFDPSKHLPWTLVIVGAALGVVIVLLDVFVFEKRGGSFRLHIMPLAVGIYLPWSTTVPILLGGLASWYVVRKARRAGGDKAADDANQKGILFASGLVAGEAIIGIILAPIVIAFSVPLLKIHSALGAVAALAGLIVLTVAIALRKNK
ncbi:MAG TPA: oligopeptide transporter, OPT family [bacterium]|nr:oligopeptide transporter, OPT family [bacterium]